jgi:type II secretory pathway pseudopilin PulG
MNRMMMAIVALALAPTVTMAQNSGDRQAVQQAAANYVTAVYESKPELIEQSVHPKLTKYGFMRQQDGTYKQGQMTYDQLLEVAKTWNKDKKRDTSIKKVQVLDVLDQTATAKIEAQWGIDYMQLAKFDGTWKIINIIWQTHPVK